MQQVSIPPFHGGYASSSLAKGAFNTIMLVFVYQQDTAL